MTTLSTGLIPFKPSPLTIVLNRPNTAAAAQRVPLTTPVSGCVRSPTASHTAGVGSDTGAMRFAEFRQSVA